MQREKAPKGVLENAWLQAAGIFCFFAVITLSLCIRLQGLAADDSYIHLRIARHLIETGSAYFNRGERVMVTSSPVWTILLSLSMRLFHRIPPAAPLEAAAMGIGCSSAFLLARRYADELALRAGERVASLLLSPVLVFSFLLRSSVLQMETALAVALLLFGLLELERGSPAWLALFALAAMTRYEYWLALLLFLFVGYRQKKLRSLTILLGAAVCALGLTWLFIQYGTIVPNTILAKRVGYTIGFEESFRGFELTRLQCFLLLPPLAALLAYRSSLRRNVPTGLTLLGAGLGLIYVAKKTVIFPWYPALALTPFVVGLALSMATRNRPVFRLLALLAILSAIPWFSLKEELAAALTMQLKRAYDDQFSLRVAEYRAVGSIVNADCPAATLLTSEIGGLGDGFQGKVVDAFGLATPQAIRYHPMPVPADRASGDLGEIPPAFVQDTHPDLVVTYAYFGEALLARYDRSAYQDLSFPSLPASLRWSKNYPTGALHVLVSRDGVCDARQLSSDLGSALATR